VSLYKVSLSLYRISEGEHIDVAIENSKLPAPFKHCQKSGRMIRKNSTSDQSVKESLDEIHNQGEWSCRVVCAADLV